MTDPGAGKSDVTRMPVTLCWHCDRAVDSLSAAFEEAFPHEGDITLCLYCGAVAIVGPGWTLIPPSEEKLDELEKDREFMRAYIRFAWARQRVMLGHHLLGYEAESNESEGET